MQVAGNRIRQSRRAAGLSQSALAERVGVHRSAVAQWESSGGCHPTVEHCSSIAIATDVSFEWLMTGRGRMRYRSDLVSSDETPAVLLNMCAQSEVEERALLTLRRLSVSAQVAIVEMMAALTQPQSPKLPRKGRSSRPMVGEEFDRSNAEAFA